MARRRLPKLNACKVRPERFHRMTEEQLMNVWSRLGASAPSRTEINSLLKGLVSNLAAMKSSSRTYRNDPVQRRQAMGVYRSIVRNIEAKLRVEQARQCGIQSAMSHGDYRTAVKLRKQRRR